MIVGSGYLKTVEKLWGLEYWIANNSRYCLKILRIRVGGCCSLHYHPLKDETFYVNEGSCQIQIGEESRTLMPGDSVRIPPGTLHRFWVPKNQSYGCEIMEVSTTHDDSDVIRLEESCIL